MGLIAFHRAGSGPPLVLVHGIGMSRHAWDPVTAGLAEHFDVLTLDLPGFGDSPPLDPGVEPHPAALAAAVAALLDDLDLSSPHVVGNSLGGWIGLELAAIRPAASLTLLSPAGLWPGRAPLYNRISLRASRWLASHCTDLVSRLVSHRPGRYLVLRQTHGRPGRMTAEHARALITTMGTSPGFDATMDATTNRHYQAGRPLDTPVTVAFGSRDLLLLRRSRQVEQLPPGTRIEPLAGCGHVPMTDDPAAVAALITAVAMRAETAASARHSSA